MLEYYQMMGSIFITSLIIFVALMWGEKTKVEDMGFIPRSTGFLVFLSGGFLMAGAIFQIIGLVFK